MKKNMEQKNPVRLQDIAAEAHVSIATVAKVLSGSGGNIRVGADTCERVREIARRMNYQPNMNARSLSGRSSRIIGILMDSEPAATVFRLLACLEKEAESRGYRIMIGEAHDSIANLYENYRLFKQYSVDGVICLSHSYPGGAAELYRCFRDVRDIVFVGKPSLPSANYVNLDHESSMAEAVVHLHRQGRSRIGIITANPEYESVQQRLNGYRRGLELCSLPYDPALVHSFYSAAHGDLKQQMQEAAKTFVRKSGLDALLAPNDICAAYLIRELAAAGIRVPQDIPIIGHDNEPFAECLIPALTTIDESSELLARHAMEILLEQIRSKDGDMVDRHVTVHTKLVVRESA